MRVVYANAGTGMYDRVRTLARKKTRGAWPTEHGRAAVVVRDTRDQHPAVADRTAEPTHSAVVVRDTDNRIRGDCLSPSGRVGAHDAQNEHGVTPLTGAVMDNDMPRVRWLLDARADPNVPDGAGQSALLLAVWGRRKQIAETLVQAGAGESGCYKLLPYAVRTQALSLVGLVLRAGCDYTLPEAPSESTRSVVEAAVRERWLAVFMCLHARLGTAPQCAMRVLPHELLQQVCLQWLSPRWLHTGVSAVA